MGEIDAALDTVKAGLSRDPSERRRLRRRAGQVDRPVVYEVCTYVLAGLRLELFFKP